MHFRQVAVLSALVFAGWPAQAGSRTYTETPVDRTTSSIPVAVQQRYMSRAIEEAAGKLDFSALVGKNVSLEVSGVLQMSEQDLGQFVRQTIESNIAMAGGRVDSDGRDGKVMVRLGQAGIDRVTEVETHDKERGSNNALSWALVGAGATGVIVGFAKGTEQHSNYNYDYYTGDSYTTYESGFDRGPGPAIALGLGAGAVTWGIVRFASKGKTKKRASATTGYRVRVDMKATVVPSKGTAWSTEGSSDLPVTETWQ